jgi:hypothetical protein
MAMKHTARFTSPLTVGSFVTGISEGITSKGKTAYSTEWSGIYAGVQISEWDGKPAHSFRNGIIDVTPQRVFQIPVSRFTEVPAEPAPTTNSTWCKTCGNPVENRTCNCWCMVAQALQQYLGMDFDASAQMAADMWEQHANKESVWSAEYANDHDAEVYPDTRAFAPEAVREQDYHDYPHDKNCPRCGRRQWTDEHAQETCQACGYTLTEDDFR